MSLRPGQSLLQFRLIDKIGEGGMGEVWRAVDTTLDREVAIKVLPAAFAGDPERLARFEREAKVLASLNHPNIATIHGFHEADGLRFLALELVRGEDLAALLARGPMRLDEVVDAAKQVASALEAAHDSGVVHRDLKPANVKRTPEGQVKVLDFGLAKALETATPASGRSATVTSAGTQAGIILGTASYMSPEQARGQNVDRRSDLWAFGCLLFEMLSGRKAFDGPTITDVLAAVVTGEPDWSKLPVATPAPLRRLLRRCLEKDVRKRLRDAGDAALLLDENPEDAATRVVPSRRYALPIAALVIALAGIAGGWSIAHRGTTAAESAPIRFHRLTNSRGMVRMGRFASDGRTIVFGAGWGGPPVKLYIARTDSPETAPLALPAGELLSISKSGELAVALGLDYRGWMGTGTLARAPLLGGSPREVVESVRSADWSPDGSEFAIVRAAGGLDQLEYPPGKVLDKTTGYIESIRIAADGGRIAYADHATWGDNQGSLSVVDRAGKKTVLAKDFLTVQGVAWAPGGREVWFSGVDRDERSGIFAVDLAGRLRVVYTGPAFYELLDVAPDGRLLVAVQRQEREGLALMDGDKEPRPLVVPGQTSIVRALSTDGKTVLVTDQLPKDYVTYALRSDRPGAARLATGEGLSISWDGTFALLAVDNYRTMTVVPLGIGAARAVPNPDAVSYETIGTLLPDGKRFVVGGRKPSEPSRAFVCELESGACRAFGAPGVSWTFFSAAPVSPDGRVAVLQAADGTIVRMPIDGSATLPIPGLLPGEQPIAWAGDGASLFVAGNRLPIQIARLELATGRRTPLMTLSPTDPAGMRFAAAAITPDGKHWALGTAKLLSDVYVVDGLR